jgi:arginine exporter protein ArgO
MPGRKLERNMEASSPTWGLGCGPTTPSGPWALSWVTIRISPLFLKQARVVRMVPFFEGVAAGYGIAIPVGAVAILIVNTAIVQGFRLGAFAGAGAATADTLYAAVAVLVGGAAAALLAPVAVPLRAIGGFILIGFAVVGILQGLRPSAPASRSPSRAKPWAMYLQFLGITIINPLTVIYFAALVLGRGPTAGMYTPAANLLFILGVALSSLSWQTLLAGLGGLAGTRLSGRFRVAAVVIGNLIVLILGARILLSALL